MSPVEPIFPVGLRLARRRCLVVGGGAVAGRKVASLLSCRAAVTLVAPEVHDAVELLVREGAIDSIEDDPLDVQLRPYSPGEASGYRLVVTATGVPEVDRMVASDAESAGVWVNSADDVPNCTFVLPAVERRGNVTVAVSTAGTSPALAGWLRDRLAAALGPGIEELASLLAEARTTIHESGGSTQDVEWRALLDGPLPGLVARGRMTEAKALLRSAIGTGAGPQKR